jgi:hypothetical protein
MRFFTGSFALVMLVLLVMGCNTVDADECWPNTSGGFGGSGTIPIGAGVGATSSGGDFDSPSSGTPNPCVAPATSSKPDEGGSEQGTYIRCLGLGPTACAAQCNAIGAYCVEYAIHPEDPSQGAGTLKQCLDNLASYTCTYCYANGDVCTFIWARFGIGHGGCTNTGGKGCE